MKKVIPLVVLAGALLAINPLPAFATDASYEMHSIRARFMSKGQEVSSTRYKMNEGEADLDFVAGKSVE